MLLYYITDRHAFPGSEQSRRRQLLLRIAEAARAGVDYIQLREKDLPAGALELLARDAVNCIRDHGANTKLLINSRTDIALAAGADGVHLTSNDIAPSEVRSLAASAFAGNSKLETRNFLIAVSCPSLEAVRRAEAHGADFAVLAPIFEKHGSSTPPLGLDALRLATGRDIPIDRRVEAGDNRHHLPVLALGGITLENAADCLKAGASGIAAIRLFQQGDLQEIVKRLRDASFPLH